MRFHQCCLFVIGFVLLTAHRLPAPIVEENPTPAPEQMAKPKPKRPVKPKATIGSSESSTKRQVSSPQPKSEAAANRKPFTIPQSQMAANATSAQEGNDPRKAIDGNPQSFWTTPWNLFGPLITLPQSITLNLGGTYDVTQLRYLPRQDIWAAGNIVTYRIYTSTDGTRFTQIAAGSWADDHNEKSVTFTPTRASYIRLEAVGGHEGHAIAAELNVTAIR